MVVFLLVIGTYSLTAVLMDWRQLLSGRAQFLAPQRRAKMNQQSVLARQADGMMASSGRASEVSSLERGLLVLPLVAGAVFGLLTVLVSQALATFTGYSGN